MAFLERFKGKLSHLTKLGLINNLEMSSSPIQKLSTSQLSTSSSRFPIEKIVLFYSGNCPRKKVASNRC